MYQQNNAVSKQKTSLVNLVLFVAVAAVLVFLVIKEMDRFAG